VLDVLTLLFQYNVSDLVTHGRKLLIWHAAEMMVVHRRPNFGIKVF